ncbi:ParA family protein [Tenacibaculum finnmarkense]|uniref:ParA family protein n=1 Tax=Tenacibaculum finnmarkense TaxID=2781243 RepID=UPI001EFB509D|nr:ParA family protein [Tenacibaculum finnmarkense]MCG8226389.1 ParA family protein [Tenacibaculum finnmarkense genomovar finnmarkense]
MIISIGNQKGGVGKTTLCILLANYLATTNKDLLVVDFDFQTSFYSLWEEQKNLVENEPPYEVIAKDLKDSKEVVEMAKQLKDVIFILDLPGKIDDDNLYPLYQNTDLLIIPFAYDKIVFESTLLFIQMMKHLKSDIKMLFIPNRIKSSAKFKTQNQINEVFSGFGTVLPKITERVCFQRLSVFENTSEMESIVEKTFIELTQKI